MNAVASNVALALSLPTVGILPGGGSTNGTADPTPINLICSTGSDAVINVLDPCSGFVLSTGTSGLVIDCSDAGAIE